MDATETKSAVDSILAQAQVSYAVRYAGETTRDKWQCDAWRVSFKSGKSGFETDYFTGLGHRKAPKFHPMLRQGYDYPAKAQAPDAAGVLYSLILDMGADEQSFADWCSDFGSSDDSIDAFETYRKCCKIASQMRAVFKPETIKALRDALQDY